MTDPENKTNESCCNQTEQPKTVCGDVKSNECCEQKTPCTETPQEAA